MTHTKSLKIPMADYDRFGRILDHGEPVPGAKCDEVLYQNSVRFDNGYQMDIKVVNGTEEDGPWTEGVLFDEHGTELGCTEVGDTLGGGYIITVGEDVFCCVVARWLKTKNIEETRLDQPLSETEIADLESCREFTSERMARIAMRLIQEVRYHRALAEHRKKYPPS